MIFPLVRCLNLDLPELFEVMLGLKELSHVASKHWYGHSFFPCSPHTPQKQLRGGTVAPVVRKRCHLRQRQLPLAEPSNKYLAFMVASEYAFGRAGLQSFLSG